MAKAKSNADDIALLRKDIADLNKKVEKLQLEMKSKKEAPKSSWRKPVVMISAAVATLVLVFGNIFFWTGRTLVDTNRYVATVGPLIQKPPIQSAIASYTTTQIFDNFNVQSYIKNNLPTKVSFLAPELTSQVRNYTQTSIKALLANSKVQNYWYKSLERRHNALISFSKTYQGNGTIYISDIYSQISKRLSGTQLSFLANKRLPAKVGSIKVTSVGWLPAFHKLVNNIDWYELIAVLAFIISSGLAIFLSSKRLRMVIKLCLVFAGFMLITLLAIRIMQGVVMSQVHSEYRDAVKSAYQTITHSFADQTINILIISLVIALVAWLTGKYDLINKTKKYFSNEKTKVTTKKPAKAK